MQAQMCALLSTTEGISVITENIFPQRYMHVAELKRMGAQVQLEGATAVIEGVDRLHGAPVMASDLRASAALVLAGLKADGDDGDQPRLSHRSRLRTSRRKAERAWRAHRACERVIVWKRHHLPTRSDHVIQRPHLVCPLSRQRACSGCFFHFLGTSSGR